MKRDYTTGKAESVQFFLGNEVEHTPAYGMKTLFITGLHSIEEIENLFQDPFLSFDLGKPVKHIFFGANHSFNPQTFEELYNWGRMISYFLDKNYLCSLDIPLSAVETFNELSLNEYDNFIPQIRIPIPYANLWNYNTMLKIDDKDFKSTNPGVWTHSLHDLKDRSKFTAWSEYKNDYILK